MLDFILGLWLALSEWASQTRESGRMHRQFAEVKRANRQFRAVYGADPAAKP